MRNFVIVFGAMVGYLGLWAIPLLAGAGALNAGAEGVGAALLIGGVLGCVLGLLPFMHWLAGRVFRFEGDGAPISEQALRQRLLTIADRHAPVMVLERRNLLIVTWNYVDQTWWNVLSRSGLKHLYELQIKLDDRHNTATLIDVKKSVDWRAGPTSVRLRAGYSRGVDMSYERVVGYGWDDAFQFGRVVDYQFKTTDIKDPVVNLILESGWCVKFGLW